MSLISKLIQSPKVAATIDDLIAKEKQRVDEYIAKTTQQVSELLDELDATLAKFAETGEIPKGWIFNECEKHGPEFTGDLIPSRLKRFKELVMDNPHLWPSDKIKLIPGESNTPAKIEINQVFARVYISVDEGWEEVFSNIPGVTFNATKEVWERSGYEIWYLNLRPSIFSSLVG